MRSDKTEVRSDLTLHTPLSPKPTLKGSLRVKSAVNGAAKKRPQVSGGRSASQNATSLQAPRPQSISSTIPSKAA